LIGGSAHLTACSRQGGGMRSRQSRSAVGSPASANSTALAGQSFGFAVEQNSRSQALAAACSRRPVRKIARLSAHKRPPARRALRFRRHNVIDPITSIFATGRAGKSRRVSDAILSLFQLPIKRRFGHWGQIWFICDEPPGGGCLN
jgi:hypothetical protein